MGGMSGLLTNLSVILIVLVLGFNIFDQASSQGGADVACNATTTPGNCHCLPPSVCQPSGSGGGGYICHDYQCDRGWRDPPCCQQVCSGQTFGTNCQQQCHCRPNDTCNPVNGFCSSGGCDSEWGGTACQIRLPKLISPPLVSNGTCTVLYVTWRPWSRDTDIGDPVAIDSYTVEQRVNYTISNATAQWTVIQKVESQDNETQYMIQVVVSDSYSFLEFRVITNWLDFGKPFPGRPSDPSPVVRPITFCIVIITTATSQISTSPSTIYLSSTISSSIPTTSGAVTSSTPIPTTTTVTPSTTATTTTRPNPPGSVTSVTVDVFASSIRLSWSAPPSNASIGLSGYNISYGIIGIGDCNASYTEPRTSDVVTDTSTTTYTIQNTTPWRKYFITISAINFAGHGPETNATVISQEIAPSGAVQSLATVSVMSRQVSLVWDDVTCADRGGILVAYEVKVRDTSSGVTGQRNATQRTIVVTDLTPFTRYAFTVQYINRIGRGPSSTEYFVTTLEDVPSAPRNVLVPIVTDTLLQVTWSAPVPPNGVLLQYRVIYWRTGLEGSSIQTVLAASLTTYNITGLSPYTNYCVQIQAQTGVATNEGWGNRSDPVCRQTQEGLPSEPIDLKSDYTNESCISVRWMPPTNANGLLVSYKVTYKSKSVPNAGEGEIVTSTSQLMSWICSRLIADVQYNIQVQASTSRGFGSADSIDVWTEISRPEPPPVPRVISVENTTASVRIEPAVLSHGPVAAYFIVISPLQSSPVEDRVRRSLTVDPVKFIPLPGYTTAQLSNDDVRQAMSFVIGDNATYGNYINRPLEIGRWYSVYYVVASSRDGVLVKMNYAQTPTAFQTGTQLIVTLPTSPPPSTGVVVAAAGGLSSGEKAAIGILVPLAILLIILALLLLYFCWWRKRKQEKEYDTKKPYWLHFYQTNFMDTQKKKWNDIYSLEEPRHVVTTEEGIVGGPDDIGVDDLPQRRKTFSFEDEYRQLPEGQVFQCTEAQKGENAEKNRFEHLLAYDHTRVHLETSNGSSDYYNANYIPGYDRRRKAYIAAQSPFNELTICDFWLMVYEQKITKIVFLARLLEDSVVKSEKYWSDDHLTHHYGNIAVTLRRTHCYANFVIRTFVVSRIGQYGVRTVTQYQFTSWPDHGVPDSPFAILEFRRKVGASAEVPLLVHCGTGVSRSAVYIAIDFSLAKAEAENSVNVYRCCSTMRQCRPMMVRTLKQYIFIYEALFEALIASHLIVGEDVKSVYDVLKKTNPTTSVTYFKEQLQLLERYLDDPTDDQCKTALRPENRAKNRFSTLRLIVRDRDLIPMRGSDGPTRRTYINALSLDSYTRRGAFIVTQSPLASTVADFWNLICDQNVSCIVALNGRSFREDTCVEYWPSVPNVVQKVDGGFRLTLLSEQHKEHVIVRTLQLTRDDASSAAMGVDTEPRGDRGKGRGRGRSRTITQYQFQSWNMYDQIPWSNGGLLELIDSVSKEQTDALYDVPSDVNGDALPGASRLPPVLVHCIDGAGQSGLFCACYVICQKMNLDKEVDVFHTIKEMKQKRFHFVNSLDQYKFCFKLLWDFVNFRMIPSTA